MPALTQAFEAFERPGIVVSYKLAAVKVFKGALLGVNSAGFATPMTHATANLRFIGIANETVDNSAGAAGAKSVAVTKTGSFVVKPIGFTAVIADLGKEVYANTDWEIQIATAGLTNQYKVGTIVALENTSTGTAGVRVRIDNYSV
jgi:hypothetical protein